MARAAPPSSHPAAAIPDIGTGAAERRYHHGDLKHALVQAGLELLEEQGLPGLTLRACAARAGVSHAAPKNHFGSLKGLITAIATEGFRRHAAEMQRGLHPDAMAEDRLRAAMQGYVRFAQGQPNLFEMMFSPNYPDFADPALHGAAEASYAVLRGIATGLDWDKAGEPDGQLRSEMLLWSLVHGYALLSLAGMFGKRGGPAGVPGIAEILPGFGYRRG